MGADIVLVFPIAEARLGIAIGFRGLIVNHLYFFTIIASLTLENPWTLSLKESI